MCFIRSSTSSVPVQTESESVEIHKASADSTKNTTSRGSSYSQNFKTTPVGLSDDYESTKKTLLGE